MRAPLRRSRSVLLGGLLHFTSAAFTPPLMITCVSAEHLACHHGPCVCSSPSLLPRAASSLQPQHHIGHSFTPLRHLSRPLAFDAGAGGQAQVSSGGLHMQVSLVFSLLPSSSLCCIPPLCSRRGSALCARVCSCAQLRTRAAHTITRGRFTALVVCGFSC